MATGALMVFLVACSDNRKQHETAEATQPEQHVSIDSNAATAPPISANKPTLPVFAVQDVNGNTINLQSLKSTLATVGITA